MVAQQTQRAVDITAWFCVLCAGSLHLDNNGNKSAGPDGVTPPAVRLEAPRSQRLGARGGSGAEMAVQAAEPQPAAR